MSQTEHCPKINQIHRGKSIHHISEKERNIPAEFPKERKRKAEPSGASGVQRLEEKDGASK
jgi:hypothetical protein